MSHYVTHFVMRHGKQTLLCMKRSQALRALCENRLFDVVFFIAKC